MLISPFRDAVVTLPSSSCQAVPTVPNASLPKSSKISSNEPLRDELDRLTAAATTCDKMVREVEQVFQVCVLAPAGDLDAREKSMQWHATRLHDYHPGVDLFHRLCHQNIHRNRIWL